MRSAIMIRAASLALAATLSAQPTRAEVRPAVLDAVFAEPEAPKLEPGQVAPAPIPPTCKIAVTGVADTRTYQTYMGNFFDQPFQPPADKVAWVKSMAQGLSKRGFDVKFAESGAVPAGYRPVRLELKHAWIDYPNGGFQALVKLRFQSEDPARPHDKVYRGTFWRTLFMATVGGRSNEAFHNAVAVALDNIADDTKAFCGG
jgi:hypothetical protein